MESDEKKDKEEGEEEKRSGEEVLKKETKPTCNSGGRYRTRQPRHSSHPGVCTPQRNTGRMRMSPSFIFRIEGSSVLCCFPLCVSPTVFLSHSCLKSFLLKARRKKKKNALLVLLRLEREADSRLVSLLFTSPTKSRSLSSLFQPRE